MSNVKKHTFNQGVDTILGEAIRISDQRGTEYQDTWNLENIHTPAVDLILRMKNNGDFQAYSDPSMDKRFKRLLTMAALIDVKISRLLGPYKEDSFVDLINYSACFAFLMREFQEYRGKFYNGLSLIDPQTFLDKIKDK